MSGYSERRFIYFASIYGYGFRKSAHVVLSYVRTLLVVQSSLCIIADASDCIAIEQKHAIAGWACQPFDHKDITNVPYHHCSMPCIQNQNCQAFIYDNVRQLCMMLSNPCVWTQPYAGHSYAISKPQCFRWEDPNNDYSFYWYYEAQYKSYVDRRLHQGDMVVGKVTNAFHAVDPNTLSSIHDGVYENLLVDPSCQVAWVSHDANTGQPLPADALIGGVLSATNTPLYVVRQLSGANFITGYYNPINNLALGQTWISGHVAINTTVFEVMTLTRPWQHSLINHQDSSVLKILIHKAI